MIHSVTDNKVGGKLSVSQIRAIANAETIIQLQQLAANIAVDKEVMKYAVRIVRATREWQGLSIGAGPRGSISLIRAARAVALMNAHNYVTPDDIKQIALPVLRHRVALAPEMELEGYTSDYLLKSILSKTEAPRQ